MRTQTLSKYLTFVLTILCTNIFAQPNREKYTCYKINEALNIDGKLDEAAWQAVAWSNEFVDIEGDKKPKPLYGTQMKMLWDDQYLYIAAKLEEPHLWATYDKRDMVIFHENDFEIFIDPDGDTHNYYEFEINAKGTFWDLMMLKPYRDGGPAVNSWDIKGLKKGIHLQGSLNDGSDRDTAWTLELAFPWEVLKECAPKGKLPSNGDFWRINFSRVQWQTEWKNGAYEKTIDPSTGKHYPEFNWVWSPQGVINMHQPETWGYVYFLDASPQKANTFTLPESEEAKDFLRDIYYQQKAIFKATGSFTNDTKQLLKVPKGSKYFPLQMAAGNNWFYATTNINGQKWRIREDGKVWKLR